MRADLMRRSTSGSLPLLVSRSAKRMRGRPLTVTAKSRAYLLISLLLATPLLDSPLHAQDASVRAAAFPTGATLRDLADWFRSELPRRARDQVTTASADRKSQWTSEHEISDVSLKECILKYRAVERMAGIQGNMVDDRVTVPLTSLRAVSLLESRGVTGFIQSKREFSVFLSASRGENAAFLEESSGWRGNPSKRTTKRTTATVAVHMPDATSSQLLVDALARGAALCGNEGVSGTTTTSQPTAPEQAIQPRTSSRASTDQATGNSIRSNEDVIKLVASGLSPAVVANAVRTSRSPDFDVSPAGLIALKRSNVPDSIVLLMQTARATSVPSSPPSSAPMPAATPLFDTSLVPKRLPLANGCDGIENMGLAKNDVFDRAMGGGLVAWHMRIRNNSSVARIVEYGWIDMYGQQQKGSIQIRGGEIANPRLDLTQTRPIAPVRDLRVIRCQ